MGADRLPSSGDGNRRAPIGDEEGFDVHNETTAPSSRGSALIRKPLFLLGIVLLASIGARAIWISNPRDTIFDEIYYVNAARRIDSIAVPPPDPYADAQSGTDPNTEHPPLAKLMIAASIRVFGDNPMGWRLPSIFFGTLAVAAMYWFARSAGASEWAALGAAGLMAVDNLFVVHSRIATLDIFAVAFMLVGVALYLRRRPVLAGAVLGIGACTKLIGFTAVVVLVVLEVGRRVQTQRSVTPTDKASGRTLADLGTCVVVVTVTYLVVLGALDRAVTAYSDPIAHTRAMVSFAGELTKPAEAQIRAAAPHVAQSSSPWQWLINQVPINYFRQMAAPPGQPGGDRVLLDFQGRMSPFIIWLAVPAFGLAIYRFRDNGDETAFVIIAWCLGTFIPLITLGLRDRVGYIYYMLIVLPGVYLGITQMFSRRNVPRIATAAYGCMVATSFVALFPFRTWGGR